MSTATTVRRLTPLDAYPFCLIHGACMGSFAYFITEETERLAAMGAPWTAWAHRYRRFDMSMPGDHCFDLGLRYGERTAMSIGTCDQTAERYIRLALARPQLSRRFNDIRALAAKRGINL